MVRKVRRGYKVQRVPRVRLVQPAQLVLRDPKDLLVRKVHKDLRAM